MASIAADFRAFKEAKIRKEFQEFKTQKLTGPMGPQGPQGIQGPKGEDGSDGRHASVHEIVNQLLADPVFLSKVKGRDGLDGTSGLDGKDGLTTVLKEQIVKEVNNEKIEEKILEFFETPQFKSLVQKHSTVIGGSLGISPGRVTALESRVTVLEDNPSGGLQYTALTTIGTTTYTSTDFIFGNNIIGVNAAGAVTIRLPDNLTTGTLITINDESLDASTNNITIETYKVT